MTTNTWVIVFVVIMLVLILLAVTGHLVGV